MNYAHIRARYNVPAKRGARVEFQGQFGTVTSSSSAAVRVRMDGMLRSQPFAPDELRWLDTEAVLPFPQGGARQLPA
ncbi:polysaccharide deacetylase [Variovorax sp. ZS18.2.2]|uniref:polysaccharide deacetylase n=1 Tax=Variovorax sp. ZS18.2.2 TaxID=2971255 RepID=UPI0021516E5B|nr:polysaccharide deacetylase [Variovorax sp. ZS18.2.2]MCR6475997.1 polysaccharide deacetylase [Variovorax sp. ZS18.2.2]